MTAVSEVAGVDHAWDVTASGGNLAALTATVTLGFANGQDIADTSSNALANLTPTGTDENTYEVDNTAPTVDSAGRASGTSLVVTFSEDLAAGGQPGQQPRSRWRRPPRAAVRRP